LIIIRSVSLHRRPVIFIVALCLTIGLSQTLWAAELKGSLSGDLYGWNAGEEDHLRPYVSLRANLLALKTQARSLSFHTYSRWKTDWQDKTSSDPQFFVYDAYLKFKCKPRRVTLYAGRQFVYSAVGSALVDGLRLNYGLLNNLEFDLFGGSRVSRLDPERIESLADFAVFGGQMSYQFKPRTKFGLSWMRRMSDGFVSYHRLGVNVDQILGNSRLYGRLSVNPEMWRPSEFLVRARHNVRQWYFSGEFLWRDPSVSHNSIFSLIEFDRYREARFEVQRNIQHGLTVFGNLRVDFFSSENAWTTNFGLRTRNFTVAWVHQTGYAGESDGLNGSLYYQPFRNWQVFGQVNVSQYRIQDEQEDLSEAYATGIGLLRQFGGNLQMRAEWQYLRNAVQSYDSRFHFRITKGFDFR